ncbi:large conductance mechanosensitive channel protein MscL [Aneurinibacillus sp. Ricciae_BoGa-3]|uniref:large conductance mechanosensitive channel protein MscL n=1 Tax=Aneurinibacillus sp. Ricciae_BoGa-3 TaxID=3022697 RepID=UPI00233F8A45|nr:large conductance mechanosensitive channel protein MscL [Aneurinibacillus sp. Ricciae_BoGa-3]WCK52798.1 large conductance mechanosensitive channel protein MscL [Aneurinibacillus sp. Ricciae_BoGa-3]
MRVVSDFKKFISKGNIIELAVGVAMGTAFNAIVNSLVKDIIMPPIGKLLNGADFSSLYINLSRHAYPSLAAAQSAGAPTINYGLFLNNVLHFLIIAITLFVVVRTYSRIIKLRALKEGIKEPADKECPYCLSQVPYLAVRCQSCTSFFELAEQKKYESFHEGESDRL